MTSVVVKRNAANSRTYPEPVNAVGRAVVLVPVVTREACR